MVTALLVYCSIGSLIWLFLDYLGIIKNTFVPGSSSKAMVMATAFMIVGWPYFIFRMVRGMLAA
jgi:hypothetical protein